MYHPRKDKWMDHFELNEGFLVAKSEVAKGTIKLLNLNDSSYVELRKMLVRGGVKLV